ncbi:kelch-like protein 24 [Branchiostoma lanceolatum]|uniref:kelch-like protein 24 n=1 Tax=Branchiostoma lanceolatum TaxID=7740 RepID=UPI0034569461
MMEGMQSSQTSFDFSHNPHAGTLLQGLQELRSDDQLVDVSLCVSGLEIPCHRNVLAACSEYFRAMFCNGHRESKERKITIQEVNSNVMQLLVDYAYTSKVTITEENAAKLLEGANFFQIQPVREACVTYICNNLDAKNCLRMLQVGNMLSCPNLEDKAKLCALKEFAAVSKTPAFLSLTKDQLVTLVSSDDLNATEEVVYEAVMTWINHDTRKRKKEMRELMELVRFPFMDKLYFLENVENNDAVRKSCHDIVKETHKFHLFPGEVKSPRTRPRPASGWREEVVTIGGIRKQQTGENSHTSYNRCITSHRGWGLMSGLPSHFKFDGEEAPVFAAATLGTSDIIFSSGIDVFLFHSSSRSTTNCFELDQMKTKRHDHKLAVSHGKVYAIGGRNDNMPTLASVEVYDQREKCWKEGDALPQPRYSHAVAVLDGNIYVIGGYDAEKKLTSTVYCFKPGDSEWEQQKDMPVRGACITAAALNGNIYVAGLRSKVLCFKPGECGGAWSIAANTGVGRFCGMAAFAGKIQINGGYDKGKGSRDIWCLDPETRSLNHVGYMSTGLFSHACVTTLNYRPERIE